MASYLQILKGLLKFQIVGNIGSENRARANKDSYVYIYLNILYLYC